MGRWSTLNTVENQTQAEQCPTCGAVYALNTGACPVDGALLQSLPVDPLIGTALPRHYRITDKLGRGAMSVVYKGIYEPLNQPVAIKMLKAHLVSDLAAFKRFQQEAKTAGALEHPNIVAIFDFGVTDQGVPYLVMELIEGVSLQSAMRSTPFMPVDEALRIFMQTADALEYTHQRGVIHRDIKPSNIFLQHYGAEEETVKVLDFGIAKLQNYKGNRSANLTHAGEVFGTPLYLSPEQAMARPIDLRSDIYSLGCVMYEALAGRPPFNAATAFEVIRMQCTVKQAPISMYRPADEVPPSLVMAIERCMEKDPENRFQSMQELISELQKAEAEFSAQIPDRKASGGLHAAFSSLADHRHQQTFIAQGAGVQMDSTHKIEPLGTDDVSSAFRSPAQSRQLPHKAAYPSSPWPLFVVSSLVGCLTGVVILFGTHQPAGEHATSPTAVARQEQPLSNANPQVVALREQGLAAYDNHDYALAQDKIAKALSLARDTHDTITAGLLLADQCMLYISMNKIQDALDSGTAAAKIFEDKPGVQKKDLSFALRALGTACFYDHDLAEAEKLLRRSVSLDEEVYGSQDERFAIGIARLAKVLEEEKKWSEAEKYYRQALAVSQSAHRPGDPHLVMRMRALAEFLRSRHHAAEAKSLESQATRLEKQEGE